MAVTASINGRQITIWLGKRLLMVLLRAEKLRLPPATSLMERAGGGQRGSLLRSSHRASSRMEVPTSDADAGLAFL
jgi:hypothetical protein